MNKGTRTKKTNEIISQTTRDMESLGIYKSQYDIPIKRYAEMRLQYEVLKSEWIDDGCNITEEYVNKSGATNIRKTAQYTALEMLRKELFEIENTLGLTPKGYKAITNRAAKTKKASRLEALLDG